MTWLGDVIRGILEAILRLYGGSIGKTVAKDAVRDEAALRRAGSRIRTWMQSRDSGQRGGSDQGRPGDQG